MKLGVSLSIEMNQINLFDKLKLNKLDKGKGLGGMNENEEHVHDQ